MKYVLIALALSLAPVLAEAKTGFQPPACYVWPWLCR